MARIFSQSQGKFIDVPDQNSGAATVSQNPAQNPDIQGILQKAAIMDLANGGKNISKISAISGLFPDAKGTSDVGKIAAKDLSLADTGIERLKQVADQYQADPSVLTKQLIPGQLASRKFDSAAYDAMDALLRLRTGAQANPTEIRGYMKKLMPTFGDSPEVVQQKINNLQQDFANYGGDQLKAKVKNVDYTDLQKNKSSSIPQILGAILGGTGGFMVGGPVGAGLGAFAGGGAAGAVENSIKDLTGTQTQKPLDQVVDVSKRAAGSGVTAYSLSGLGELLGSGVKKIGTMGVKGALANRSAAVEEAAAKGIKFSGKELFDKAEQTALKNASETDLPRVKRILDGVKQTIAESRTPEEAVKKLGSYNKAYSEAGKVGKTAKAVVDDAMSKATRELFANQAPNIADAQSKLAKAYKVSKFGKNIGNRALGTGVGMGAAGLIGWLLGRKN